MPRERGDRRARASRTGIVHDVSFLLWELARHGVVDRDGRAVVHEREEAQAGELDGVRDRVALELREECRHDHNHVLHALAAACRVYRETAYVC